MFNITTSYIIITFIHKPHHHQDLYQGTRIMRRVEQLLSTLLCHHQSLSILPTGEWATITIHCSPSLPITSPSNRIILREKIIPRPTVFTAVLSHYLTLMTAAVACGPPYPSYSETEPKTVIKDVSNSAGMHRKTKEKWTWQGCQILDQVYCAWLIKWVIKREIIQSAELCLTRWWIINGTWWYWVSIWRYWLVLGQYKLVLLGIRWYKVSIGLLCLNMLKKVEIWSGVTSA